MMSHHNHQLGVQMSRRIFDTSGHVLHDNIAGVSDDKQIAKTLIKDQFDWDARVRTTQDDGKQVLPFEQVFPP